MGNHTWHHPDMSHISSIEDFQKELEYVETAYKNVTGKNMTKYYRPPQGKYSEANLQMAKELGYKSFFWSLAYVDWYQDNQPSKEEAFSNSSEGFIPELSFCSTAHLPLMLKSWMNY